MFVVEINGEIMKIIFTISFLIFITFINATIINIPTDQPTIQEGINVAVDGDTVLVQPNTYFENINYNSKNITVASLFLTTQDTTYVSQTIIDGNQNGNVVTFENEEDSTAVLCGFTISNGFGFGGGIYCVNSNPNFENITITNNVAYDGGGIYCVNSNPYLKNVTITNNMANDDGGGIYCGSNSNPILENVIITNNSAEDNGGGIYCAFSNPNLEQVLLANNSANSGGGITCYNWSNPILENVSITNNSANKGGGICCMFSSNPNLENVTITENSANDCGGGIFCRENSSLIFSSENRCNIFSNIITGNRGVGVEIFSTSSIMINVIVDTFIVLNPSDYYTSPIDNFTFDILNSIENDLINSDFYVAVDGEDTNSGTSVDEPFQTITHALQVIYSDSLNINTIYLADGVYSPSTNGESFPIMWSSYVNLSGNLEEETILDAENTERVIEFRNVTEALIEDITISGGFATISGGGILCWYSNPRIENVTINNNSANKGGGISCSISSPNLKNVTIANNIANDNGGGIYCVYSSNPSLENSILWNDSNQEIYFEEYSTPNTITIAYSDIQGGEEGIVTNNNGTVYWENGNIDSDPLFVDPINGDYHLTVNSPCIDAGDPNSPLDPDGTITDMGAYYFDQNAGMEDFELQISKFKLNNYPNPFNPSTTISFSLPQTSSLVNLEIYNIKGQKIKTFPVIMSGDEGRGKNKFSVVWNGTNYNNQPVSSGIYLYKLNVDGKTEAFKKCLLLK